MTRSVRSLPAALLSAVLRVALLVMVLGLALVGLLLGAVLVSWALLRGRRPTMRFRWGRPFGEGGRPGFGRRPAADTVDVIEGEVREVGAAPVGTRIDPPATDDPRR